ncbi:MAG: hypothetical protein AB1486_12870 [Planctomycetota bacterium]
MAFQLGPRRATFVNIEEAMRGNPLSSEDVAAFEAFDLLYRSLCALLFNYVPTSGHPGGSISSGRFVAAILFDAMDYDLGDPERPDADMISYAAGHKALGLYAIWALRNEMARVAAPHLLPADERYQLRLEDLLGFRRNPVTDTHLYRQFRAKPLDGHPTPATPFVKLATGASGVGVGSSLGLALGARDYWGTNAPKVHIVEGEGGLTPGRVAEAVAAAGTASLDNAILHVDWNQASIDSNHVCREGSEPGDYVQWDPTELFYLHDWNVILVPDGRDFQQIIAAQRRAAAIENGQPTAIAYHTTKGWRYGIEGRASHGAGHKLCSAGFYQAMEPLFQNATVGLPACREEVRRCAGEDGAAVMEKCFWESLELVRQEIVSQESLAATMSRRLEAARQRLDSRARRPRERAPRVEAVYDLAQRSGSNVPPELLLRAGTTTTLRGELGRVLNYYNKASGGALFAAAADLLDSTSIAKTAEGFPEGTYHTKHRPEARRLSIGGICEDAMAGIMSGLAAYGRHIGVASSYGAFMAPLGHIAARLHGIATHARRTLVKQPPHPMILVCAHAGLKTGEDGPTHADPQALQLLQENFPAGTAVTLTPWDAQELWPLVTEALVKPYALIVLFVTRPTETVPDRARWRLAPATDAVQGVYKLREARGKADGTIVLQESGVTIAFVEEALPLLDRRGVDLDVYYVASAELFGALPPEVQERIFPSAAAHAAMGITGFTLPTMFRWIRSERGRAHTLHPFQKGHFLGSGPASMVLREAGLDGESQVRAILKFLAEKG